jgi:hypothetical protein
VNRLRDESFRHKLNVLYRCLPELCRVYPPPKPQVFRVYETQIVDNRLIPAGALICRVEAANARSAGRSVQMPSSSPLFTRIERAHSSSESAIARSSVCQELTRNAACCRRDHSSPLGRQVSRQRSLRCACERTMALPCWPSDFG